MKTRALDLEVGDVVWAKGEFGRVCKKGRTFLHDHKFVVIEWVRENGTTYRITYFFEDMKMVEKISKPAGKNNG